MRKRILVGILIIVSIFMITGCNSKNKDNEINNNENSKIETNKKENNPNEVISSVRATINGKQYTIQLEDNETSKGFANLLPQEFIMNELNGNEKYIYLDTTLQTNSSNPKHINSGDVMLYGNNCLVIFYKSFDTSYSYTKIGHIDNLSDLGNSSVLVKFFK